MKTLSIVISCILLFAGISPAKAQKASNPSFTQNENIKVWGECGMCKKKIEKAAITAGAEKAEWNAETKSLQVRYNKKQTTSGAIQQAIASIGYDTKDLSASAEAYNKLDECCQYERKPVTKTCCDKEKCDKDASKCKDHPACKDMNCCK